MANNLSHFRNCLSSLHTLINNHVGQQQQNKKRKLKILELGSGNGFLGVCCAAAVVGQKGLVDEIVVTDLADHLTLMRKTVQDNEHICKLDKSDDDSRVIVRVVENRWGVLDPNEYDTEDARELVRSQKFDIILGSDVAYRDYLHIPLIESLNLLLSENGVALIGVTMQDTSTRFFDRLTAAGFQYNKLADHLLDPEFRGSNTFALMVIQRM